MQPENFLKQIQAAFPRLQWKTHRYLLHGWDHHVIILDEKLVFRMPKERNQNDDFLLKPNKNQAGFTNEIKLLNSLSPKVDIGIPDYKYISPSIAGYPLLHGQVLTTSLYQSLSDSDQESVLSQLAQFITTLHATPRSVLEACHVELEDPRKDFEILVQKTQSNIYPRLQKKETLAISTFFAELEKTLEHPYAKVLVHNDLRGEHILWDAAKKQINLIDFSDRALGDPAMDFIGILRYGPQAIQRALDLYEGEKDEHLLHRAHLYYKRIPLLIMNSYPGAFDYGVKLFRERFDLKTLDK